MNDWHLQELSIRISTLESCDPNEIFSNEVENIIQNTLKSLSKQTCQAFLLSRFENKSNKEIAEQMGISVKGVEYHISKSLKALRISLKDYLPLFYFSSIIKFSLKPTSFSRKNEFFLFFPFFF